MLRSISPRPAPGHRRQAGSAYIVALVILFVLTVLGLSLTLITQTELQIGANERTITRVFYGADAGISTSIARALVRSDNSAQVLNMTDSGEDLTTKNLVTGFRGVDAGTRVEVSPFFPVLKVPCNLCEINNAGTYGGRNFEKVTHAVTATAQRFITGDAGANRQVVAEKSISTMIEVEPWQVTNLGLDSIDNTGKLKKIGL